ncbi:MAG: hypothetical protein ABW110_17575 [Steroidobacteraceae bacterium]
MSAARFAQRSFASHAYACRLADEPSWLVPASSSRAVISTERVINDQLSWQPTTNVAPEMDVDAWTAWVNNPESGVCAPYLLDEACMAALRTCDFSRTSPQVLRALALAGILVPCDFAATQREHWHRVFKVARASFENGWAPVRGLIPPLHLGALRRWYRRLVRSGFMRLGDGQTRSRYAYHNEPVARFFHQQLTAAVKRATGREVRPSYVYFACYQSGADLAPHVDRPQCEYTLSLLIDFTPEPDFESPWPLKLRTHAHEITVYQAIGDALLYRGREILHWRDPIPEGCTSTSLFLHYVDADFDGPLD